MKTFIGKRVTLSIGGNQPPTKFDENTIVGQDTFVHVPDTELHKYQSIVGEQVTLNVGDHTPLDIQQIKQLAIQSSDPRSNEVVQLCEHILVEQDPTRKSDLLQQLMTIGSQVATIGSFILQYGGRML